MAKQTINLGTAPTGTGGDTPRSAFTKIQANVDELYSALGASGSPAALPAAMPVAKGGTGGVDQPSARSGLGLGTGDAPQFTGLEISAAAPYIDFHFGSTTTDYNVRLQNYKTGILALYGALEVTGTLVVGATADATGYRCRTGLTGAYGGNYFNFNWTGSNIDAYIESTYVGTMTLFTSDYRIKKDIVDANVASFMDRIDAYRIVNYEHRSFNELWEGDGTIFQGLIAHEVQAVNPLAVRGAKDAVGADGQPIIQQLDPMALITDLIGAVKELRAEIIAMKVAADETPTP